MSGLCFTYEGGEADLMFLEAVICLVSQIFDGEIGTYTLNREDKSALDNHIQSEGRCQHNALVRDACSSSAPTHTLQIFNLPH